MEDETVFRFLAKARLEAKGDEAATVRLALRHAESAVARLRHLLGCGQGTLAPNDWEPAPKSPRGPETTLTHSSSSAGPQDCVGQFMGARLGDMADDVLLFVCGFLALQAKARLRGASSRLNVALMGCPIDLTESTMVADKVRTRGRECRDSKRTSLMKEVVASRKLSSFLLNERAIF